MGWLKIYLFITWVEDFVLANEKSIR